MTNKKKCIVTKKKICNPFCPIYNGHKVVISDGEFLKDSQKVRRNQRDKFLVLNDTFIKDSIFSRNYNYPLIWTIKTNN